MHQTIAWSENQDPAGALVYVAAVPDQVVTVQGDDIRVPAGMDRIIGAQACIGATGTRAYIISPQLRRLNPQELQPVTLALFPSSPAYHPLWPENPIQVAVNESLNALLISDPAAAEQATIYAHLAPGAIARVTGNIRSVRFTVTIALVAGQWANAEIAFADDLPSGTYRVVGSMLVAPTAVVARWVFKGGMWRPGFPVAQTLAGADDRRYRYGELGEWGTFDQTTPPSIDILSSAAAGATTYSGVMDIISAQQ